AAGETASTARILLATDSAYASLVRVKQDRSTGESLTVPVVTIDQLWEERKRPAISFCKIDVEGAELQVLRGAEQVLRACRPALILEADPDQSLEALGVW